MNNQVLKFVLRRISKKGKLTFLIFIGLVIGLTTSMVAYLKVNYELSFDRNHTQADNTYRICRINADYLGGESEYRAGTYFPLPELAKKNIPEINNIVKLFYRNGGEIQVSSKEDQEKKIKVDNGIVFTESSFFDIFDFGKGERRWINNQGDEVLSSPFTAVLTQKTAKKFFGNKNPIGQSIVYEGIKYDVIGVVKDFPQNTDFPFKVFLSISTFIYKLNPGIENNWGSLYDSFHCYVVLKPNSDLKAIEHKLKTIYSEHSGDINGTRQFFELQALNKVHKEIKYGNFNMRTVSSELLGAISLFGIFIFLIACFNYSNFFLAETSKAEKQTAIKRIIGGNTFSIVYHFFIESFVVVLSAFMVSLPLVAIIVNKFYSFIDIPKGFYPEINLSLLVFMVLILFVGSFLPVFLSTFNLRAKSLSSIIKKNNPSSSSTSINFKKSSVIFQFIVAQAMIIVTLVVLKQIHFINNKDLGFKPDNIIVAKLPEHDIIKLERIKNELISMPEIREVSYSSVSPAEALSWNGVGISVYDKKNEIDTENKLVDNSYFDIYSFNFISGSKFLPNDTINTIIVNREFVSTAGFINEKDALGAAVYGISYQPVYIKGVVENFHSGSLHNQIRPCVFQNIHRWYRTVNIKLTSLKGENYNNQEALLENIDKIAKKWANIYPEEDFNYSFLDDRIANYYQSEHKTLKIFSLLALLCVLLCAMGILSLSVSMNEVRIKEIGIRKVNGAKIGEVVSLLNYDFIKWVIIALIIASPLAYYAMNKWLENFAYKTDLSWWIFTAAGIIALFIALITVSWQSWRAARKNPVEALRYE